MLIDLEAACRAVCDRCRMGERLEQDPYAGWYHRHMVTGGPDYTYSCSADALRKLAAEEGVTTVGATVETIAAALDDEEKEDR